MDPRIEEALAEVQQLRGSKFQAKLTPRQRREVTALILVGLPHNAVSAAFAIHPKTVSAMANLNKPFYRDVKDELLGLGNEEFKKRYLTLENIERVRAYMNNSARGADTRFKPGTKGPNPKAHGKQGWHKTKDGASFEVRWFDQSPDGYPEETGGPAWYFKSESWGEDEWMGPCDTSAHAYERGMGEVA